jgi:ABC transport system ATP-binding/permease protein
MLDRLCTDLLGLDGLGGARLFADLSQYEQAREEAQKKSVVKSVSKSPAPSTPKPRAKRLSFLEEREWEQMEAKIMVAEGELDKKHQVLGDPAVMSDHKKMGDAGREVAAAQAAVDVLYRRWEELAAKRGDV